MNFADILATTHKIGILNSSDRKTQLFQAALI